MISFDEYKRRRESGLSPEEAWKQSTPTAQNQGFSLSKTISNIPGSVGNLLGGVVHSVIHPVQTAKNVGRIVAGGVEKLIPGQQAEEPYFNSLSDYYKKRYGTWNGFLDYVQNDPAGFAADVSTVLSAGGALAGKLGQVSKLGTLTRTGEALSTAADISNPLTAVGKITGTTSKVFSKFATKLEKGSWRLTPTREGGLLTKLDDAGLQNAENITKNRLNEVADFMTKQKIVGTPLKRYAKVSQLYQKTENILDDFFGRIAKGRGVPKQSVVRGLQTLKGVYKGTRDYEAIGKQIDGAINSIKKGFDGEIISYKDLNRFKRTTYENAYNQAGTKVLNSVEHSVADVIRGQLDEGLRGLKIMGQSFEDFNHNYGLLIEGRKILKSAVGKAELSRITERILGGVIGYAVGGATVGFSGPFGALLGGAFGPALIDKLPVTAFRSGAGAVLQKAGELKIPQKVRNLKAPLTGIERLNETQR